MTDPLADLKRINGDVVCRLPGEFETQNIVFLVWRDRLTRGWEAWNEVVMQVANAIQIEVRVVVLCSSDAVVQESRNAFKLADFSQNYVRWIVADHDSEWILDFGPLVVNRPNSVNLGLDFAYQPLDLMRPLDDRIPLALSQEFEFEHCAVALKLEGGNILSNGQGICISTRRAVSDNAPAGITESQIVEIYRRCFGATQVVFVDELRGEPNGHIDTFAVFTSADTIVVGSFDQKSDPANSKILDEVAEQLARVKTATGPLRVIRLPMLPAGKCPIPATFTNLLFANRVVLMPGYRRFDKATTEQALKTLQELLPGRKVIEIDCAPIILENGGLHCLSLNATSGPVITKAKKVTLKARLNRPIQVKI